MILKFHFRLMEPGPDDTINNFVNHIYVVAF